MPLPKIPAVATFFLRYLTTSFLITMHPSPAGIKKNFALPLSSIIMSLFNIRSFFMFLNTDVRNSSGVFDTYWTVSYTACEVSSGNGAKDTLAYIDGAFSTGISRDVEKMLSSGLWLGRNKQALYWLFPARCVITRSICFAEESTPA